MWLILKADCVIECVLLYIHFVCWGQNMQVKISPLPVLGLGCCFVSKKWSDFQVNMLVEVAIVRPYGTENHDYYGRKVLELRRGSAGIA